MIQYMYCEDYDASELDPIDVYPDGKDSTDQEILKPRSSENEETTCGQINLRARLLNNVRLYALADYYAMQDLKAMSESRFNYSLDVMVVANFLDSSDHSLTTDTLTAVIQEVCGLVSDIVSFLTRPNRYSSTPTTTRGCVHPCACMLRTVTRSSTTFRP